jgi:ketosteroid isomerase-like protein
MKSEKSRFLDECYERVYSGDMAVFDECFTPDYTLFLGGKTNGAHI